jgi:hypothetical protein
MSVVIGMSMAAIFERGAKKEKKVASGVAVTDNAEAERLCYIALLFFSLLGAILLVGASELI